jgi:Putative peptidoglycan binding domain/L,D-transpeptidase catalytic domain
MRRFLIFVLPALALAVVACGSAGVPSRAPRPATPSHVAVAGGAPAALSPSASPSASPTVSPSQAVSASPPRVLRPRMRGRAVRLLQRRLAVLKYYPGRVDGRFGSDTLEAVWAFQETQGLRPRDAVTSAMQRALASPRRPKVLVPHGGRLRVEVNMKDQVLVLYKRNHVALVSHVSTAGGYYFCSPNGCGDAITPTGDFTTLSFLPGWVTVPLGEMYNPVFFIGTTFAIHGDTDVPLQPASHGCVRIPMDIAAFFYTLVPTPGTPVYIRG